MKLNFKIPDPLFLILTKSGVVVSSVVSDDEASFFNSYSSVVTITLIFSSFYPKELYVFKSVTGVP